ncbi:MAG: YjgP/YjgQ family permease [Parvularculaceae bacterium]|nr:YjgP/YjgQ family permease [Parvularculaceae bacterium]
MSRLDRYIFRAAALPFLLILACTTAVAWLTQVLQRLDIIVDDGGSFLAFLKITVLLIPSLAGVVTPIALLAACLYVLNVLMVDSEIPVMRAAGASRLRIARPLIVLSVLAAGLVLWINADLQPRTYKELRQTVYDVRSNIASSLVRDRVFANVAPGVTFYAEDVRPGDQYVGLHIYDSRDPEREVTYTAENGLFTVTDLGPRLFLLRGTAQWQDKETGKLNIVRFNDTFVDVSEISSEAPTDRPWETEERYLSELLNPDLNRPYNQRFQGDYLAEFHGRLATPLYCIAFALIAALAMLSATTQRRGYGQRIMVASAVAGGIRIIGFLTRSVATDNSWANVLQYAIPGIAIVVVAIALLNPSRTQEPRGLQGAPA